jgi:cyclase
MPAIDDSTVIPYGGLVCSVYVTGGLATSPIAIPELDHTRDLARIAAYYLTGGADRLFLDVQDTWDEQVGINRSVEVMAAVGPPLWVSVDNGAIPSIETVRSLLDAGAQAVTVNTTAVDDPDFVREAIAQLGGAHVVGVLNATAATDGWEVAVDGGRRSTGLDVVPWSARLASLGISALIVNDLDRGLAGRGYNLPLIRAVADAVPIPVIACGGSGSPDHLPPALTQGGAHAVFVYSMVYSGRHTLHEIRSTLDPHRRAAGSGPGQ